MLTNRVNQVIESGTVDASLSFIYEKSNRYSAVGHDNAFIPDLLDYKYFITSPQHLKYFRNVPRVDSAAVSLNFNFSLYWGSYENNWIGLYTTTPTPYLFGQSFSSPYRFAYLDLQQNKIIAEDEVRDRKPGNEYRPIYFRNLQMNDKHLILVFNALTMSYVLPFYEKLLNPFSLVSGYQYLYHYLKRHSTADFYLSTYVPSPLPKHYTIYNPKVMVFYQDSFYTYNGTQFVEYTPVGTYLTVDEVNTHGITIADYNLIPKEAFLQLLQVDNLFGTKIQIITNGYIYPTYVDTSYWLDKYNESYFLWAVKREQQILFVPGLI